MDPLNCLSTKLGEFQKERVSMVHGFIDSAESQLTMRKVLVFAAAQWNLLVLLAVAVAAIAAQTLGLIPNFSADSLLLALLVAYILYQIVENLKTAETIGMYGKRRGSGAYVRVLHNTREFFAFAAAMIDQAQRSIDVCYFTPYPPTRLYGDESIRHYWELASAIVKKRGSIVFRRIVTVENKEKYDWLQSQLSEFSKSDNFSIAVIQLGEKQPILNVMIVDEQGAFIFSPHSPEVRNYLWVEDPVFCRGIQEYYNSLWHASKVVKNGANLSPDALDGMEK